MIPDHIHLEPGQDAVDTITAPGTDDTGNIRIAKHAHQVLRPLLITAGKKPRPFPREFSLNGFESHPPQDRQPLVQASRLQGTGGRHHTNPVSRF